MNIIWMFYTFGIELNLLRFEVKILLFRLNISLNTDNDRRGSIFHNIRVDVMFLILRWQEVLDSLQMP